MFKQLSQRQERREKCACWHYELGNNNFLKTHIAELHAEKIAEAVLLYVSTIAFPASLLSEVYLIMPRIINSFFRANNGNGPGHYMAKIRKASQRNSTLCPLDLLKINSIW